MVGKMLASQTLPIGYLDKIVSQGTGAHYVEKNSVAIIPNAPPKCTCCRKLGRQSKITPLKRKAYIGCSGWYYWEWRDLFYSDLPRTSGSTTTRTPSIQSNSMPHSIHGPPCPMCSPGCARWVTGILSTP